MPAGLQIKKTIFILSTICIIVLLCFLIPIYVPGFQGNFTTSEPGGHNRPIGMISKGKIFVQEHITRENYLNGIEILFATWDRKNTNSNRLVILDKDSIVIANEQFSSNDIRDNHFYPFNFPRDIYIGKGNKIFICIFSNDGNDTNGITAWSDTTLNNGNLYQIDFNNDNFNDVLKGGKINFKGSLVSKTHETDRNNYFFRVLFLLILFFGVSLFLIRFHSIKAHDSRKLTHNRVLIIIFIVWIITPGIYFFGLKDNSKIFSKIELRSLQKLPKIEISTISNYPKEYESYFQDHFPAREEIISISSQFNYEIFNRSIFPTKVILGKDGWLFRPGERQVLEDSNWLSIETIDSISDILHNRAMYYKQRGITFYIALVPFKSDIYKSKLPDYYRLSNQKLSTDIMADVLISDSSLNIIDLKQTMSMIKDDTNAFYKTDFHWSEIGAYEAYYKIMKRISQDFPLVKLIEPFDFYLTPSLTKSGNDAVELGLENYITEPFYNFNLHSPKSVEAPKAGYKAPTDFGLSDYFELVRTNPDTLLPRIVVIRDSFFHLLAPLVGESFSKSVYIWDKWQYGLNEDIIAQENPDIILLEAYVSFLPNLLKADRKDQDTITPN